MSDQAANLTASGLFTTSAGAFNSTLPVVMVCMSTFIILVWILEKIRYSLYNCNYLMWYHLQATKREYKTLPRSFQEAKQSGPAKEPQSQSSARAKKNVNDSNKSRSQIGNANLDEDNSAMHNLNVGISNLISGGINFFGQLRRKNSASLSASSPPPR